MAGIYIAFIVAYLISLLFIRWVPERAVDKALDVEIDVPTETGETEVTHQAVPRYVPWLGPWRRLPQPTSISALTGPILSLATVGTAATPEWVSSVLGMGVILEYCWLSFCDCHQQSLWPGATAARNACCSRGDRCDAYPRYQ